jgi:hypothetical protein
MKIQGKEILLAFTPNVPVVYAAQTGKGVEELVGAMVGLSQGGKPLTDMLSIVKPIAFAMYVSDCEVRGVKPELNAAQLLNEISLDLMNNVQEILTEFSKGMATLMQIIGAAQEVAEAGKNEEKKR